MKRIYLKKVVFYSSNYSLKLVGVHVMESDYKNNGKTFISICVEAFYMFFLVYTLFYYRNDVCIGSTLTATPSIGFMVPVSPNTIITTTKKSSNFAFIATLSAE